ncbi:uvrD/REP helicase N-terminal domain protein, partial [Vibrio parahaemolyticus V-223/04]
CIRR